MTEKINISDTLEFRSLNPNTFDYSKQLLDDIEKLVKTESWYLQRDDDTKKILPKLALSLQIINHAKDAIAKLNRVNASDKKISYYESANHANIDDLIEHFKKKLKSTGEESLNFPMSKKEFKLKLFITRLGRMGTRKTVSIQCLQRCHNVATAFRDGSTKFSDFLCIL